jgi:TPR repeat protein
MVAEPGGSVLEHEALARDSVLVAQYRQAARQGDGLASFKLAEAFERGRGVAPDLVEALT